MCIHLVQKSCTSKPDIGSLYNLQGQKYTCFQKKLKLPSKQLKSICGFKVTLKTPIKPSVKKWLLSVSAHTNENARLSCLLCQLQGSFRLKGDGKEIVGHINILWNPMLCCRAALTFSHLVLYLCKRHCMKCVCVYSFK